MASFPDLRPHRRSATAERLAVSKTRTRFLLAVSTALFFTACLAVTELATLHGKKAHDASAFLTRELGPPLGAAPLVRTPAHGVRIRIRHGGFDLRTPSGSISLVSRDVGRGSWRRFEHGALRNVSIGQEAVAVNGRSVEQSLRVVARHGRRTWRWRLDSDLKPRLANGYVGFFAGHRLVDLEIQPVKILDDGGRDVTPKGAHWSLKKQGGTAWLELALDDAKLPLPYTIDPAVVRSAGAVATGNGAFNVTIPAGVQTGDLLVLVLAQATNAIPATPTGWSVVTNSGGVVAGGGTKLGYATFYRKGLAADSNTTAGVTTTAAGVAEVLVYRGVDTTLTTSCPSATCMIRQAAAAPTGANSTTLTFPTITTAMASEEVVGTGTTLLDVAWPAASTTGSYARQSPVHANNGATISLAAYDQNVTTSGTAVAGTITITSAKNLGFTFGLTNDTNPPASGAEAIGGISPAGVAYQPSAGGTIYYNGNGSGQFTISDPITDAESGPGSVSYPAVATSGWTHALETVSTGSNYTSAAYQWNAGTHTAPSAAERTLNEKDNGDNATTSNIVAIVDDSTAPAGGALTVNGTVASGGGSSSYDSDGSFTIGTRTDYTETQSATASGLASATLVRTSASYSSPDVCGAFASPSTI
ncbi:MAG: hypothetical protein V7645_2531, partial [Actinomycetota bacterium]